MPQRLFPTSRRGMIRSMVGGSLLLPGILSELLAAESSRGGDVNPLAPRTPHFPAKARRVIFLYLSGGVSHLDTFDPKPRLHAEHGKNKLLQPLWKFRPRASCGTEVSDLFPRIGERMDDICLIRSMISEHNDHAQGTLGVHTGSVSVTRPSLGAWVSYGLGTENQDLPSFVVLAPVLPYSGTQVWGSDFLPGCHQGTRVVAGAEPVPNLNRRAPTARVQELELGLLDRFNRLHRQSRPDNPALSARIKSFETAFGMQRAMPDVLDLTKESDATLRLYGLERGETRGFAWQALVARRMAERGVRFVELIDTGSHHNWDSHGDMHEHEPLARNVDQPIAALIQDLKARGMLDETLIVCTTEFGRTPEHDGSVAGRNHHTRAFSSWMAGGGIKGGIVHGKTDEYGREVVEDPVTTYDFHATILHLLGFDHERLTYRHAGRDFRLTDVHGAVVKDILA
ncbi:MAG: DUF1501 domain-containing protein [Isosphaeraceae bacterium]